MERASRPQRFLGTVKLWDPVWWGGAVGLALLATAGGLNVLEMSWSDYSYQVLVIGAAQMALGILGVVLVILALARLLRRSQEKEEWFRGLVENATNVFYAHTADGWLTYVSPQMRDLLGLAPEELPERWTELGTASGVNDRGLEVERRAIETGSRQEPYELELRHADGHPVRVLVTEAPVVRDGRTAGLVGSLTDITALRETEDEARRMEEHLRHAHKMEAVGELTGGVAHDLNNHLSVVLGNVDLLLETADERQAELLEEVRKTGRRSAEMVRKLLGFSRKEILDLRSLDVVALVREYEGLLRRLLPAYVRLDLSLEEGLSGVNADATSLGQILLNLVANARDAMPEGGSVEVAVGERRVEPGRTILGEEVEAGTYGVVSVSDSGAGMPPEVLERVFEPFFTTKAKEAGTGLGLSMVHGLVRQHGGHVAIDSREGEGTRVEVLLPASGKRGESSPGEPDLQGADCCSRGCIEGALVLVVDDDPAVLRTTGRLLEAEGCQVMAADNGEEALELIGRHSHELDAVLTDLVMPGLGGVELCREGSRLAPELLYIFVSGYSAEDRTLPPDVATRGVFLPKPWSPEDLRGALARIVRRR